MFSWLFGKKDQAVRAEDSVWMSAAARLRGIGREVERLTREKRSVVVVALTLPAFDDLVRELAQHKPSLCRDLFGLDVLRSQLARPGSITVALGSILATDAKPSTSVPVEFIICGRNESQTADESILRFADLIGPTARATFHLSLNDAILSDYVGSLTPLLGKLSLSEDEAISSPLVTRAIANAQSKKASRSKIQQG
jgi:hypothetical protein